MDRSEYIFNKYAVRADVAQKGKELIEMFVAPAVKGVKGATKTNIKHAIDVHEQALNEYTAFLNAAKAAKKGGNKKWLQEAHTTVPSMTNEVYGNALKETYLEKQKYLAKHIDKVERKLADILAIKPEKIKGKGGTGLEWAGHGLSGVSGKLVDDAKARELIAAHVKGQLAGIKVPKNMPLPKYTKVPKKGAEAVVTTTTPAAAEEAGIKLTEHPIKWYSDKFNKHPIGTVAVTAGAGGLGVVGLRKLLSNDSQQA